MSNLRVLTHPPTILLLRFYPRGRDSGQRQAATLIEVATRFGRTVGTLSEAVRRVREGAADPEVVRRVQDRLDASS